MNLYLLHPRLILEKLPWTKLSKRIMNLLNLQSLPLETWADPEVNSTNIAILSIILLILLSLPPQALSLRRNLGLMIVMKMTILQDQKLLLRIMFFSKRWNWFCMQRVFQEVLSKSQKKNLAFIFWSKGRSFPESYLLTRECYYREGGSFFRGRRESSLIAPAVNSCLRLPSF